jgi:uncharacterized protein (TIGR02145 family)
MKKSSLILFVLAFIVQNVTNGQWNTNGTHIYNINSGNVGVGNSSPATLLYVAKNMSEPTITVRNLGGIGGATYTMTDNASGANWKFKATNSGGFKIRDHANGLDVFVIEPNSSASAIYIKGGGNVGIGTSSPEESAAVDINSTDKGLLIPRLTQNQISLIPYPANGLQVFCTDNGKIFIYVAALGQWKEVAYASNVIVPPFSCGIPITIDHIAGNVAPVTKTVTYGTVSNIPGETSKCWITSNLGADHQATSVDDITEASAGWFWQFNRAQGYKHDGTVRTPNTTWISNISENYDWGITNDPCALLLSNGWRLPTYTEWYNVDNIGGWTNWNGPWNSGLYLHAPGHLLSSNGSLSYRGTYGNYWSSSQGNNTQGWYLRTADFMSEMNFSDAWKANGFTVRCLTE